MAVLKKVFAETTGSVTDGLSESSANPTNSHKNRPDMTGQKPKKKFLLLRLADLFVGNQALPRSTIVSSFVINLLGLALPLVMLQIYDRILTNKSVATLAYLILGLSIAIVIEAFLKLARAYLMSWNATKQSFQSDLDAFTRLVYSSTDTMRKEPANVWMDRFESLNKFNAFSTGQSRLILLDLPFVAIYLGVIFLVGGDLGYILIGLIVMFVLIIVVNAKSLRRVLDEQSNHNQQRDEFVVETLEGIETVKAMIMEPQMLRRFERLQQTTSTISHKSLSLSNELQIYASLLGNFVLISIVTIGAIMVIGGSISIGTLACCTLLTSRVLQPVMRGVQVLMELENAQMALDKARHLFDLPKVNIDYEQEKPNCRGEITLRDVSFAYDRNTAPVLQNINLEIAPGQIIGIQGEQAGGKSTFLRLIAGDIRPTTGECLVDGKSISDCENSLLAKNITYLSQNSAIFEGTVMENITMFNYDPATIKSAREAAHLLALESDIHRMPLGYDTPIGQGISDILPAGMTQRIKIARALTLNPAILLFNEANSMLDMSSDTALREAFRKLQGKMTIVIISNRPSMLAIADQRFIIENGRLLPFQTAPVKTELRTAVRFAS